MSRGDAGYIRPGYEPLEVPDAPTIGTATGGDQSVSVTFTAPGDIGGGAITGYGAVAQKTSDGTTVAATGASSPITVSGLTNGSAYTAAVWALNIYGPSPFSASTGSFTPALPQIGLVFAGGSSNIQKFDITTTGNTSNFGTLTYTAYDGGACGSSTRSVFGGGEYSGSANYGYLYYFTIATGGSTSYFGSLTTQRRSSVAASNSTRGLWTWGYVSSRVATTDYITIASTGNATYFGDNSPNGMFGGAGGSSTRMVSAVTNINSGYSADISYFTYASTGNAVYFGSLTLARGYGTAVSNGTRCIFGGGFNAGTLNNIDYVTIASTGNATDFGDLNIINYRLGGVSGVTRGVFVGGYSNNVSSNVMSYITMASSGNSIDFGDLTANGVDQAGTSNCHGGLQ